MGSDLGSSRAEVDRALGETLQRSTDALAAMEHTISAQQRLLDDADASIARVRQVLADVDVDLASLERQHARGVLGDDIERTNRTARPTVAP